MDTRTLPPKRKPQAAAQKLMRKLRYQTKHIKLLQRKVDQLENTHTDIIVIR
jgi:hypothetical protein